MPKRTTVNISIDWCDSCQAWKLYYDGPGKRWDTKLTTIEKPQRAVMLAVARSALFKARNRENS